MDKKCGIHWIIETLFPLWEALSISLRYDSSSVAVQQQMLHDAINLRQYALAA
jgi:hypothetical protein